MTFAISDTVFLRVRLKVCFDDRCTLCHLGYNLIYCKYMQAPPKKKHMIEWFGTLYYIYLACVCVCVHFLTNTVFNTSREWYLFDSQLQTGDISDQSEILRQQAIRLEATPSPHLVRQIHK